MGIILLAAASGSIVAALGLGGWKQAVKPQLERQLGKLLSSMGPKVLAGSAVDCEAVQILAGKKTQVCLKGLKVHNLEPFQSPHLIAFDSLTVVIDTAGAAKSAVKARGKPTEIVVVAVTVDGCHLILEKSGLLNSNVKVLAAKLDEADEEAEDKQQDKQSEKKKGSQPDVQVGIVRIEGFQLEVTTTLQVNQGLPSMKMKVPVMKTSSFSSTVEVKSPRDVIRGLLSYVMMSAMTYIGELDHIRAPLADAASGLKGAVTETSCWPW